MIAFSSEEKRSLFDGRSVSAVLPYDSVESNLPLIQAGNGRLSISGAQEKYAMVEEHGELRFTREKELAFFARNDTKAGELIEASTLSQEAKQAYRASLKYRLSTLQ